MPTREKLESALRNAHAAGDTQAAKQLANALKSGQHYSRGQGRPTIGPVTFGGQAAQEQNASSLAEAQPSQGQSAETGQPQKSLYSRANDAIRPAFETGPGKIAGEFMSAVNRGAIDLAEFFTTDQINAVMELSGSDKRVPGVGDSEFVKGATTGGYMEPGLARDVVAGGGEVVPAAVGGGALLRSAASRMAPSVAAVDQGVTGLGRETLKQMGGSTAATDATFGALSGAGAAGGAEVGEEIAGEPGRTAGGLVGSMLAPATGIATLRTAQGAKNAVTGRPSQAAQEVLDAGVKRSVPVMNTDVNPPTTFPGRIMQNFSEKLGPLGSGTARASQQKARESAVEELAAEFGVDMSSPLADDIVQSLKAKTAQNLAKAGEQRNRAVEALDKFGEVPLPKTIAAINRQIANQERLGAMGDNAAVKRLQQVKEALQGGDFSLVKDIRSEVIKDLKALRRADDRRAEATFQSVKSAMDDDMKTFAAQNDRRAAVDWMRSNRDFADELSRTRETELKRILNDGDATPEKVLTIMRGGKLSELRRLKSSLTPEGIKAVRAAIVRDVLDESGLFRGDTNPNKVATSLGKTKRQQAIDTFFDAKGKRELDGFRRLLDATRRAQDAPLVTPTGMLTLPIAGASAIGYSASAAGIVPTLAVAGSLSAIAKSYETAAFRNLMLRIGSTKPGSTQEKRLLEKAIPAVLAGSQAAIGQQEQTGE